MHDSTTVNLYQLVDAACALRPDRGVIAISPDDFPTDRYVVDGIADARGLRVRERLRPTRRCRRDGSLGRRLPHRRGGRCRRRDGAGNRGRRAWRCGICRTRPGCCAIDLGAAGVQLAVGCTYKFLNGGPGAPAFSYVAARLQATLPQPIWGWFAQADQFDMGPTFSPQPDIRRVLLGTPSILALAAAEEGIAVTAEAGIARDRRQGTGADRLRPRPVRPVRPAVDHAAGPRRAAAATSPCIIRAPGSLVAELAERGVDHRLPRSRHRPHRLLAADDPLRRRLRRPHPPRRPRLRCRSAPDVSDPPSPIDAAGVRPRDGSAPCRG